LPRSNGSAASVSAAVIRTLPDGYAFAINVARAERLPVAEELYADGPHLATRNFEIGNSDLVAETSNHLDVGIRKSDGARTWSVTGFVTDYDDFIFLRATGEDDAESGLPIFAFDQQNAKLRGLEAELFTPIGELGGGELDLRVFTDYVDGRLRNGEDLPRMPPRRFGARLQYHSDRALVGLEATRYSAQTDVAPFETATPGYTMINADFTWSLAAAGGRGVDFFVRATNLLDELARKHTSLVKDTTPLPGRNYAVGLRTKF
jgi:iron complex outermembrane receptor protein